MTETIEKSMGTTLACQRLPPPSATSPVMRGGVYNTDLLLLTILVWYLIPEQFIERVPLVMGSRIITWLLLGTYLSFGVEAVLGKLRFSMWAVAALFASVCMTAFGLLHLTPYFEREVFGNDLLTFSALAAGLLWAHSRNARKVLQCLRLAAAVSVFLLLLTIAGLSLRILTPASTDMRVYTQSIFACTYGAASLLPFLVIKTKTDGPHAQTKRLSIWIIGIGAILAAAGISATRSIVVECGASLFVSFFTLLKQRRMKITALILLAVSVLGAAAVAGSNVSLLQERAADTSLEEESRYVEAEMLLQQLSSQITTGWGFGSLFSSPVVIEEYGLASVPHIGILAFLEKGGIVVFAGFVLIPFLMCIRGILRYPANTPEYAAAGSLLVYFSTSVLSGGWFTVSLFIYGVCISQIAYAAQNKRKW